MPKIDLIDISGKKSGTVELPREIFAAKINPKLMAQAVRVYLANQRKARAKTKTRSNINRTKAKWYRQKGTGKARHGSRSAPIFVGGGVAFGPTGKENYQLKMSKKMKKAALFSALTSQLKEKNILVIKGLDKIEPKTQKMAKILSGKLHLAGKILMILPEKKENIILAARNIEGVTLNQVNLLDTYHVLDHSKILLMKESIDKMKKLWI